MIDMVAVCAQQPNTKCELICPCILHALIAKGPKKWREKNSKNITGARESGASVRRFEYSIIIINYY